MPHSTCFGFFNIAVNIKMLAFFKRHSKYKNLIHWDLLLFPCEKVYGPANICHTWLKPRDSLIHYPAYHQEVSRSFVKPWNKSWYLAFRTWEEFRNMAFKWKETRMGAGILWGIHFTSHPGKGRHHNFTKLFQPKFFTNGGRGLRLI